MEAEPHLKKEKKVYCKMAQLITVAEDFISPNERRRNNFGIFVTITIMSDSVISDIVMIITVIRI